MPPFYSFFPSRQPNTAIWWWTSSIIFWSPAGRDRSPNDVPSQNQHYPSMSEVGNILAVWESRGAYRMMSLILQGNLSLPYTLSFFNSPKHSRICMLHMLPGCSVGCRYKLDFLTTRCKRREGGVEGSSSICSLCLSSLISFFIGLRTRQNQLFSLYLRKAWIFFFTFYAFFYAYFIHFNSACHTMFRLCQRWRVTQVQQMPCKRPNLETT